MVLEMFDQTLDPEWEIYVQPHLNGLRPDFVLLHPRVGIAVFEVKDWNLDAMDYFVRKGTKRPELWARRDGKEFSRQSENPFPKVEYYREAIYNLYCPRLPKDKGFGAITAGVIFPFASINRLRSLFSPFLQHGELEAAAKYTPLSGVEEVANGLISQVFPESARKSSMLMRPELADDLRGWLMEPDFSATQRRPLEMNASQQQFAGSRTESGFRRIKGPAGSGKSLVLAARAARLADEGKTVLVATFNITLWHYLRDLVVRELKSGSSYRNIVFVNFHSWCRDVCETVGWSEPYDELWKSGDPVSVMETALPELVGQSAAESAAPSYDAILVDEGQDYRPLWWSTLRTFLKPGGEMLMAADATQDIYGTAGAWTDDVMAGAGFRGAWANLDVSYRLPVSAVPLIRDFAERFLPDTEINLPLPQQASFELAPCRLRWVQCATENSVTACVEELLRMMHFTGEGSFANADITFLASDTASGSEVVDELESHGIRSVSTFAQDTQERRRQKVGFYMGDARIKATTLHSFKGWESPLLVIQAGASIDAGSRALIYTGLTRLKNTIAGSRLTIVSSSPDFLDFGRTWPNFHDVSAEGKTGFGVSGR
ncbi:MULTISPECIES: NERD domain-containing protein [unclassified Sphingopyxis]|uniref:NERD domain-containing protein n=1 Tax=unclassified Sphingopyxis TaxID=2614943 RepID=UPI002857726E|nr:MULTISPECIES: NERD domain-containing protein [unclassified Sphingopyxis]MDR6832072.1 hypothetical protein [Sphingopyxis sp. BE122]MDR7227814.1 hypothetical protein [Sphingopyxis sp. BE259]